MKRLKVRNQTLAFLFVIFDLGEKSLTWVKGFFIGSNQLLELFKLDSMVGYDIHEFRGSNFEFCG